MPANETTIINKIISTFGGKEGQKFQSGEIKDMVTNKFPETARGSIMPPDHCYNRTNKGNYFEPYFPLFEYQENGTYKYLGLNFQYTGAVYWKGILVGEWEKGEYKKLREFEEKE